MPETFVLENATIFDATGREPYANGAVVISDGLIQAVGPMSQVSTPRHAEVIDMAGKTVMPGLIDAHAHVGFVEQNFADDTENRHPGATYAYSVARNIEGHPHVRVHHDSGRGRVRLELQAGGGKRHDQRPLGCSSAIRSSRRPAATATCGRGMNAPVRGGITP